MSEANTFGYQCVTTSLNHATSNTMIINAMSYYKLRNIVLRIIYLSVTITLNVSL